MTDPLPAIPKWFPNVSTEWTPYEVFRGVFGASMRRKQLERLKEARNIDFVCRTYGPGVVKLYARTMPQDYDRW